MTANRKTRVARQTRKDILRFAPNFTAYVLPPDAVCLYSEDRKFFLHGELSCALASAIGQHGKAAPWPVSGGRGPKSSRLLRAGRGD
jgi:hypothetical protein